jgi:membrane associated rhomboid family serine protease
LLVFCGLPVVMRTRRRRLPVVTWLLVVLLVVVFVMQGRGGLEQSVDRLAYGGANRGAWAALQAAFAHAGWMHLLGNVYFLAAFGDGVEQRASRWIYAGGFAVLAALSIVVDGLIHPQAAVIGASGGVAGVVGACVILQPRAQVVAGLGTLVFRLGLVTFASIWAAYQALMALLRVPGTAWVAHLCGLVLGAAGATALRRFAFTDRRL